MQPDPFQSFYICQAVQHSALAARPGGYKKLSAEVAQVYAEMNLSERRFPEAKAKAEQALSLAGTQYPYPATQARLVLGLALTHMGARREGLASCQEAEAAAALSRDPWLSSRATLALAATLIESGDAPGALTNALQAQSRFAGTGQQDSEWRAWLIAARARARAGDEVKSREYGERASQLLENLRQKWGAEDYNSYLTRPDVQYSRRQLGELLAID